MKYQLLLLFFTLSMSLFAQPPGYELVWADEFEGEGAINTNNWFHQTQLPNGVSWYNDEIQHYTNRTDNAFVSDGTLKIVAKSETYTDQGITTTHTSARLNSKYVFTYGYVEIRAKLPFGIGTWPAMWTLGQNITEPGGYWAEDFGTVSWPQCGEIDIMEHWGANQNYVQSALHTPSSFGATINHGGQVVSDVANTFHTYAVEWTPEKMTFTVDDVVHYVYEPEEQNLDTWPFDAHQYILLNVAVLPDIQPGFDQSAMEIDYVRVFQNPALATSDVVIQPEIQFYPGNDYNNYKLTVPSTLIGGKARLYSLLGQELQSVQLSRRDTIIDVSGYARGAYILTVEKDNLRFVEKFIKQ